MKCQIPQITWHSRDPVLSVDFQPGERKLRRLATGGTDSHVLIWYITYDDNGCVKVDCASDLNRHSKSVNVVRFSPDGELLASGDDEGAMFVWQLKEKDATETLKDDDNINQEDWTTLKGLRGHLEDIYDISWSSDGNYLVSGSMDNTAIIWDMQKYQKLHIISDFKGYVQGVAWDPLNTYIASIGTDRALRVHNVATKKAVARIQRAPWSYTTKKDQSIRARLFYDDTLQSYCRRLSFTPDGELLIVPSGILEKDEEKFQNTTYIFSRHSLNKPAMHLPTGDKYTLAVRCNPLLYKLRVQQDDTNDENKPPKQKIIDLPYRMIFAVAACDSILLYDTEQLLPFGSVSNIHYTHLTDLTWSSDGQILIASSTDAYCSIVTFSQGELGEVYVPPEPEEVNEPIITEEKKNVSMPPAEQEKTPITPKPVVKTPKSNKKVLTVTSETNIDSPKTTQSPADTPKLTKKPTLTIKNFFASPKTNTNAKSASQEASKTMPETVDPPSSNTPTICSTTDDSLEVVYESSKTATSPKCKVQLSFAETSLKPTEQKSTVQMDVLEDDAVLSFEDASKESESAEIVKEHDWKLELSQDEEPMSMELSEPVISTNVISKPGETTKSAEKPKKRISFITLSTKTSM